MHVPKCGGNSIITALHSVTPIQKEVAWITPRESRMAVSMSAGPIIDEARFHDDSPNGALVYEFRRNLLRYYLTRNACCISGHFLFDARAFEEFNTSYYWITVLRCPIERMISHFREEVRSGFVEDDFEKYLDSEMASFHGTILTRYLSGEIKPVGSCVNSATERAKKNLSKFSLVGFTDQLRDFEHRLSMLIGRRLSIEHKRIATTPPPEISSGLKKKLTAFCESDLEVFDYAKYLDR